MAVTRIAARHYGIDIGIRYVVNGDKTDGEILTAYQYCTPGNAHKSMMGTKARYGKTDGVQCYHIVQAFKPGEITPELALDVAREFAAEHLPGYEAVIGVHTNTDSIHAHILFNSVCRDTGEKYHSNAKSYYGQIRAISDRLCAEHGLSVIIRGETAKAVSYCEWLREKQGQPTFRAMLEADMRRAIDDANDFGHFLMLMENMGYEIKHGSRLSFRLRGQEHWSVPGRRDPIFTEDGIRVAIQGNLEAIEAGLRPVFTPRRIYEPYQKHPKYTGFLALYVHYLYLLGKIEKREYPPKMTLRMKAEIMKFESYKEQFAFLRAHDISTPEQLTAYKASAEERLAALIKQRTILNVRKKKRQPLYDALAAAEALAPAKELYAQGMTGVENEFVEYMEAVNVLEKSSVPQDALAKEKQNIYAAVADVNRDIRAERKSISLCEKIQSNAPQMEKDIRLAEPREMEIVRDEHDR